MARCRNKNQSIPPRLTKRQRIASSTEPEDVASPQTHQLATASPSTQPKNAASSKIMPQLVVSSFVTRSRSKRQNICSRSIQVHTSPSLPAQPEPVLLPSPQPPNVLSPLSVSEPQQSVDSSSAEDEATPLLMLPESADNELSLQNSESVGESDLACLVESITKQALTSSRKKKGRGKTRNIELLLLPPGQKLLLEFNDLGQPIGLNAAKFGNHVGYVIRNCGEEALISILRWENVDEEKRERIYQQIVEKFEFEETPLRKQRIMQKMCKKLNDYKYLLKHDHYDKYETTEERLEHVPEGVNKEDWEVFVKYHDMEETKKQCAKNKNNRAKQLARYTGSKSYAQIRAEQAQKDPEHREPSQWKMFCIANTKNGNALTPAAKEILDKFENLAGQMQESSDAMEEDKIYHKIMGRERHGRVRGFGLGPTPTAVFGSHHPNRKTLEAQLEEANARNTELELKVKELERQLEEDRRKTEEERTKSEEMRKKMDRLVAFMDDMRKMA